MIEVADEQIKITIELSKIDLDFLTVTAREKGQTISEAIAEIVEKFLRSNAEKEDWLDLLAALQATVAELQEVMAPASLKLLAADLDQEAKK